MTTKEMIEILQAYEMGEVIEYRLTNESRWFNLNKTSHDFNFQRFIYRIKPKKLPKRWRAKKGEKYYIIGIRGDIVEYTECAESVVDDLLFAFGNYFQTREKAEKARDLMEECLNKFHKGYEF